MENYQDYCEIFYAAHYLPIALYQGEHFLCASGFYNKDDPYPFVRPKLLEHRSPSVYVSSDTGYYGLVKCGDGLHTFVLGPAYSTPVTKEFVRSYIRKNALSTDQYIYMDSIQGKIDSLKASWQALSNTVVDSNILKSGLDLVNGIVDGLDAVVGKIGPIMTIIAGGTAIKSVKSIS